MISLGMSGICTGSPTPLLGTSLSASPSWASPQRGPDLLFPGQPLLGTAYLRAKRLRGTSKFILGTRCTPDPTFFKHCQAERAQAFTPGHLPCLYSKGTHRRCRK